jgi:DNA-binding GntR family transcriptional regulator
VPDDLDDLSGVPRYLQVARVVEVEIRAGQWSPGHAVQSRNQLAARFGVARETAARAHAWLARAGYLVAVPGVGMVVTPANRWPQDAS